MVPNVNTEKCVARTIGRVSFAGMQKSIEAQIEEAREEIHALKRVLAKREEQVETLVAMVKRASREMKAGSRDLLADLEKVETL